MKRSSKIAIAVVAIIVVGAVKPEIEKLVREILGMDFKIQGKVDCSAKVSADDIQLDLLADYLPKPSKPAASKKIPIKSVEVENFAVAGADVAFANKTVTIDKLDLNLKGDPWALFQDDRTTLSDFDGFLRATKLTGDVSINRFTAPDQRFGNVTIAAVDAKGCIVNKEVIDGPFKKPEIEEVGVIQRTLVRPLR